MSVQVATESFIEGSDTVTGTVLMALFCDQINLHLLKLYAQLNELLGDWSRWLGGGLHMVSSMVTC